MEIGDKIRKIRELKGLSQENVAAELEMSVTGYGKIERGEVNLSYDKLIKIAQIFKVEVEQLISFDEKVVFNYMNNKIEQQISQNFMPVELKQLYEDKIKLLEEKVEYLQKIINEKEKK